MSNSYHKFVSQLADSIRDGADWQKGGFTTPPRPQPAADAPVTMLFSPHPDDECIFGGIALRLRREGGHRVVNIAVTQGSNRDRQQGRLEELRNACDYLGFDLVQTAPDGLEGVNMKTREGDPAKWQHNVDCLADILAEHRPQVILYPHETDANTSHIGTYFAVIEALYKQPADFECYTVETEFWNQMPTPNVMIESSTHDVGELVTALTFHVGEVERNPYHMTLPAWMIDNVRRAEIVGSQGGATPSFVYATLYRVRKWSGGRQHDVIDAGKFVAADDDIGTLFA